MDKFEIRFTYFRVNRIVHRCGLISCPDRKRHCYPKWVIYVFSCGLTSYPDLTLFDAWSCEIWVVSITRFTGKRWRHFNWRVAMLGPYARVLIYISAFTSREEIDTDFYNNNNTTIHNCAICIPVEISGILSKMLNKIDENRLINNGLERIVGRG